ncbi:MAG: division/cell wall cluster transcriptional repressor MraZ [Planctomycetota bacterium]
MIDQPQEHEQQADAPGFDLLGHHRNTLDEKRRVAIPKAFRPQLGDEQGELVLSRELGGDGCLALWPRDRFEAKLRELEGLRSGGAGVGNETVRAYLRMVRISSERVKPDRQARISLTKEQCGLAGIEREVVFVGAGDHLELWAPERLGTFEDKHDFAELTRQLFG